MAPSALIRWNGCPIRRRPDLLSQRARLTTRTFRNLEKAMHNKALQSAAPPSSPKTILIVDDEPLVLKAVVTILGKSGYNILTAADGSEAIARASGYRETIHVLLSDFEMPGMTGIELATHLSQERPEMRVLLMSGFAGGMLVLNEGWHFLPKPFIPSQLRAIVSTLLREETLFDDPVAT